MRGLLFCPDMGFSSVICVLEGQKIPRVHVNYCQYGGFLLSYRRIDRGSEADNRIEFSIFLGIMLDIRMFRFARG